VPNAREILVPRKIPSLPPFISLSLSLSLSLFEGRRRNKHYSSPYLIPYSPPFTILTIDAPLRDTLRYVFLELLLRFATKLSWSLFRRT
jgi:hypothetical protein